jgi:predicted metal-dependent hydrolase
MIRSSTASNRDLLSAGVGLFNRGHFFEAHELWEDAWKQSKGSEKLLYQGLIHAAAAIIHGRRGNLVGAESQFGKCAARLDPLASGFRGIALDRLMSELRAFINSCAKGVEADRRPPVIRCVNPAEPRTD